MNISHKSYLVITLVFLLWMEYNSNLMKLFVAESLIKFNSQFVNEKNNNKKNLIKNLANQQKS